MANIWIKAILILAGNLNLGHSYIITTVSQTARLKIHAVNWLFSFICQVKCNVYKRYQIFQKFHWQVTSDKLQYVHKSTERLTIMKCIFIRKFFVHESYLLAIWRHFYRIQYDNIALQFDNIFLVHNMIIVHCINSTWGAR